VKGRYFKEVVFLLEISNHCDMALKGRDRLRTGASLVNDVRTEHDHDKTGVQPIEILRSAQSFLTHSAITYRLLYSPSNEAGRPFAKYLRDLMEIQSTPKIEHAYRELRHQFEHVDERLHEFFADFEVSDGPYHFEPIRTLPQPPEAGRRFVRWIRPAPLSITFNKATMQVDPIAEEILHVKSRIDPALEKLH
jgi:hypothetical protein